MFTPHKVLGRAPSTRMFIPHKFRAERHPPGCSYLTKFTAIRVLGAAAVNAACGVWVDYRFADPTLPSSLPSPPPRRASSAHCHFH
eukprot:scaffold921_cov61-Phaeocystis_antarctica.AAC.2